MGFFRIDASMGLIIQQATRGLNSTRLVDGRMRDALMKRLAEMFGIDGRLCRQLCGDRMLNQMSVDQILFSCSLIRVSCQIFRKSHKLELSRRCSRESAVIAGQPELRLQISDYTSFIKRFVTLVWIKFWRQDSGGQSRTQRDWHLY
jgi:hypothetical protein